jgi:hypothetical protein
MGLEAKFEGYDDAVRCDSLEFAKRTLVRTKAINPLPWR